MVRAILAGNKTQTRRVVKPQTVRESLLHEQRPHWIDAATGKVVRCPYGQPGDRLWVRETWRHIEGGAIYDAAGCEADGFEPETIYRADRPWIGGPWKPAIHMPRWASRITLEVVGMRVERLHEITEADAMAEGVERVVAGEGWRRYCDPDMEEAGGPPVQTARQSFFTLWNHINGEGSWTENPWVWVIEF